MALIVVAPTDVARDFVGIPHPTDTQPFGAAFPWYPYPHIDGTPQFTIARPAGWTSSPNDSIAGFYLVDQDDGAATDTIQGGEATDAFGNRYGSPGIPRNTIPGPGNIRELQVSAGAYVEINASAGTPYGNGAGGAGEDTNRVWEMNGTSGAPVLVKGDQSGTRTKLRIYDVEATGSNHFVVEGFQWGPEVTNERYNCFNFDGASFGVIRGCLCTDLPGPSSDGTGWTCFTMGGAAIGHNNVVWYDNDFIRISADGDSGDWSLFSFDRHAMAVSNNGFDGDTANEKYNLWVINNRTDQVGGDLFQVISQDFDFLTDGVDDQLAVRNVHNIYIGGNTSTDDKQGQVAFKCSSDIVMSQNKSVGMRPTDGNPSGYAGGIWYSAHNVFMICNEVTACTSGLKTATLNYIVLPGQTNANKDNHRMYILGNLFYNMVTIDTPNESRGTCVPLERLNADNGKVYIGFNTFSGARRGIAGIGGGGSAGSIYYSWNNIFDDLIDDNYGGGTANSGTMASSNNYFTDPSLPFELTGSNDYANLAAAQSAGFEVNSLDGTVAGNIDFVNPVDDETLRNYDLQVGSPGIDAGVLLAPDTVDVFAAFTAVFPGMDIKSDFQNGGGNYDIGSPSGKIL